MRLDEATERVLVPSPDRIEELVLRARRVGHHPEGYPGRSRIPEGRDEFRAKPRLYEVGDRDLRVREV
jgi:hypothetical protein